MATLSDLPGMLREINVEVDGHARNAIRKVTLAVHRALVMATPVDTGRARSNWVVTVGAPSSQEIEPHAPGQKGSTGAANTAISLGVARLAVARAAATDTVYVVNNVPYIGLLNSGHSAQAPANFVETAIQAAVSAVGKVS